MSQIAARLDADLKDAMRRRDAPRVNCIRQLRSKAQEATYAKGFAGPQDDAFYTKVIAAYTKQLKGGIDQLTGERAAALRQEYQAEIDYLSQYLPQPLDREATLAALREAAAEAQLTDPRQAGKLLGTLMRRFPGRVDAALARSLLDSLFE